MFMLSVSGMLEEKCFFRASGMLEKKCFFLRVSGMLERFVFCVCQVCLKINVFFAYVRYA